MEKVLRGKVNRFIFIYYDICIVIILGIIRFINLHHLISALMLHEVTFDRL